MIKYFLNILVLLIFAFPSDLGAQGISLSIGSSYGMKASAGQSMQEFNQASMSKMLLSQEAGLHFNPYSGRIREDLPQKRPGMGGKEFWGLFLSGWGGMTLGALSFGVIGAIIAGTSSGNGTLEFGNTEIMGFLAGYGIGAILGSAAGIYVVGKRDGFKVSFGWTLLGSFVGMLAGIAASGLSFGILFIAGIFGPVLGGITGFKLSRKWDADPSSIGPPSALNSKSGIYTPAMQMNLFTLRF